MIVLIAGWAGLRASLIPLAWGLQQRLGRDVIRADLGLGLGCIRESAQRAARQLEELARGVSRGTVDIVGHSMGGLVATYLLKVVDRGNLIRSVITLGTPHRGSPAVLFARGLLGQLSPSVRQMEPDSAFLRELSTVEVPVRSRLVSIAALGDGIVPALYADLPNRPRQVTRRIDGVGHVGLLYSREVLDEVESWLNRGVRARADSPSSLRLMTPDRI